MVNELSNTSIKEPFWPTPIIFIPAIFVVVLVSTLSLPWPTAFASTLLGALMIIGAEVDARNFVLPNYTTSGAALCGIIAAFVLSHDDPWLTAAAATLKSVVTAIALASIR